MFHAYKYIWYFLPINVEEHKEISASQKATCISQFCTLNYEKSLCLQLLIQTNSLLNGRHSVFQSSTFVMLLQTLSTNTSLAAVLITSQMQSKNMYKVSCCKFASYIYSKWPFSTFKPSLSTLPGFQIQTQLDCFGLPQDTTRQRICALE